MELNWMMTLIDTLQYFIDDTQARLSDIEWEIREETNYDDEGHQERMEQLCEEYDEHKQRLEDLKQIKTIAKYSFANPIQQILSDPNDNLNNRIADALKQAVEEYDT